MMPWLLVFFKNICSQIIHKHYHLDKFIMLASAFHATASSDWIYSTICLWPGFLFNIDLPAVDKKGEQPDGYWFFTVMMAKGQRDAVIKDPPCFNKVETFTKSNLDFNSALLKRASRYWWFPKKDVCNFWKSQNLWRDPSLIFLFPHVSLEHILWDCQNDGEARSWKCPNLFLTRNWTLSQTSGISLTAKKVTQQFRNLRLLAMHKTVNFNKNTVFKLRSILEAFPVVF